MWSAADRRNGEKGNRGARLDKGEVKLSAVHGRRRAVDALSRGRVDDSTGHAIGRAEPDTDAGKARTGVFCLRVMLRAAILNHHIFGVV